MHFSLIHSLLQLLHILLSYIICCTPTYTPSLLHIFHHSYINFHYYIHYFTSSLLHMLLLPCINSLTRTSTPSLWHTLFIPTYTPSLWHTLLYPYIHFFTPTYTSVPLHTLLHSDIHFCISTNIPSLRHTLLYPYIHSFTLSYTSDVYLYIVFQHCCI